MCFLENVKKSVYFCMFIYKQNTSNVSVTQRYRSVVVPDIKFEPVLGKLYILKKIITFRWWDPLWNFALFQLNRISACDVEFCISQANELNRCSTDEFIGSFFYGLIPTVNNRYTL